MRSKVWLLAAAIISTATGSGCTEVRYITEPLPLPARPVLPPLAADDVQCLSDDAYRRLAERDLARRQYAERLETIIRATREGE